MLRKNYQLHLHENCTVDVASNKAKPLNSGYHPRLDTDLVDGSAALFIVSYYY